MITEMHSWEDEKKGGTTLPVAETATAIVTSLPLSPEVIWQCANFPHIY